MAEIGQYSNIITAALTAITTFVLTVYSLKPRPPPTPSGAAGIGTALTNLVKDTITYIPHILLLFGLLADMFTYEFGVYTIPSLIGLLSIFANWGMSFVWSGLAKVISDVQLIIAMRLNPKPVNPRAAVPGRQIIGGAAGDYFKDYDGCNVQGFSFAQSIYAPQTLVVTATIFFYYIFDLITNRGWVNSTGAIMLFILLFFAQAMVIKDCPATDSNGKVIPNQPGLVAKIIASISEGALFGGIGYASVEAANPSLLVSSTISPFPRKTVSDLTQGPNGTMVDKNGNPYVCLPNGQCVPDLSTMESRKAFANMAAESTGTGKPAEQAGCEPEKK